MLQTIGTYIGKIERQNLAEPGSAMILARDAGVFTNMPDHPALGTLKQIFDYLPVNALIYAEPSEPYRSILREIVSGFGLRPAPCGKFTDQAGTIVPPDCETRTFFHDIPLVRSLDAREAAGALSRRKSAVIGNEGILTQGLLTVEQAYVSLSSTCFSLFIKYFHDAIDYFRKSSKQSAPPDRGFLREFLNISRRFRKSTETGHGADNPIIFSDVPENEAMVHRMLIEAGRALVCEGLVDSYFGNISYRFGDTVFISQTGSSLDELDGCIDAVPLDGSSSAGLTASSELSAHKLVYTGTKYRAILHGHPKFSVIASMMCEREDCKETECHKVCSEDRRMIGVPIVPGEIGTGPTGLSRTVPRALAGENAVIVHGHGVFTAGHEDFREPFARMKEIEESCRIEYFKMTDRYLGWH